MTARRAFIGVDCGTQSTKVVLMDAESEEVLGVGRAAHELVEHADGTREQDPNAWIAALQLATRGALRDDVEVAGIGVSGQQHGLVCLDAADRPVRPAKLWNDTTTVAECTALTEAVGGADAALKLIGNTFLPGYTAPKLLWLRQHEFDAFARSTRFCLPHDYLNLWMTGTFATEAGDASGTAYFDVRNRRYSRPVLDVIDADCDWQRKLPEVIPSLSVLGRLRGEAAGALGLPAGTPVSGGGGDNMMAAIGVGAVSEGPVVVSLGTSATAFAYRAEPAVDPLGEASAFCDSTAGWLPLVCTQNCTGATDWVRHLFGISLSAFDATLQQSPPGARGLTFLPHLSGERTPNHPTGAGIFAGVRGEHDPADFVRAVVEGVTFGLRYAFRALTRTGVQGSQITLVGGGAASPGWAQLCADILELPVNVPPETEAAALGAARQARWAVDGVRVLAEAPVARRHEPATPDDLRAAAERADTLRSIALANQL